MIKFTGVNHLAMATGDMDRTIHFWRDILGMRLVAGLGEPGYRHYFFEISATDMIAFFEWDGVEPGEEKDHGRPVKGPYTFDHVSFGVETDDQLWELSDLLAAAGYDPSPMIDHGFIHSIYAFDPNGIPIEFSVDVKSLDVRSDPKMLDKAPTKAAQEGPDPVAWRRPNMIKVTTEEDRKVYPGAGSEYFHGKE